MAWQLTYQVSYLNSSISKTSIDTLVFIILDSVIWWGLVIVGEVIVHLSLPWIDDIYGAISRHRIRDIIERQITGTDWIQCLENLSVRVINFFVDLLDQWLWVNDIALSRAITANESLKASQNHTLMSSLGQRDIFD